MHIKEKQKNQFTLVVYSHFDVIMALPYHEKQYGALCAQHALNGLLQGPYFSPDVLATIGHELDVRVCSAGEYRCYKNIVWGCGCTK